MFKYPPVEREKGESKRRERRERNKDYGQINVIGLLAILI